jgi:hypothetical protein
MPLQWLDSGGTGLAKPKIDLTPLAGMPLETQILGHTEVSVHHTKVSDLAPIKGMPIAELRWEDAAVTDLSVVKDLPLKNLSCDFQAARDAKILRVIKTLETINGMPAEQFWKEVKEK